MDDVLIDNWNNKVGKDDVIFHCGDFALNGKADYIKWLLSSLNGKIYLCKGSHDKAVLKKEWARERFEDIQWYYEIEILDNVSCKLQKISLMHFPMRTWGKSNWGSYQLFGHIHSGSYNTSSSERNMKLSPNQLDVGVDAHNFTPLSYNEVKLIIEKQNKL